METNLLQTDNISMGSRNNSQSRVNKRHGILFQSHYTHLESSDRTMAGPKYTSAPIQLDTGRSHTAGAHRLPNHTRSTSRSSTPRHGGNLRSRNTPPTTYQAHQTLDHQQQKPYASTSESIGYPGTTANTRHSHLLPRAERNYRTRNE